MSTRNFLWFTLFVGLNLLQSGFTNWCPMMAFLRRFAPGLQIAPFRWRPAP